MWQALEPSLRELLEGGHDPAPVKQLLGEAIKRAYPDAIEKSGKRLAARLRARAPHLAERRADERAFKRRLANTWKEAFTLYEIVLICANEAGSEFNQAHRTRAAKEQDFVFEALVRLHSQACLVAAETFELLKGGYPHGAHARWRTLHELAVFAAIIGERRRDVAERFLLHDAIENAAVMETYQAKCARLGYEPLSDGEMAQIRTRKAAAIQRFGKPFADRYGWSAGLFNKPPRFRELEERAGLDHMHPFYDWSTHVGVHASSRGARLNILRRGGRQLMLAGPMNAGLADPGQGALISLMQVTTTLLIRGRPLDDPEPLLILEALLELTDQAGDAFVAADKRLGEKEGRFQRAERLRRAARGSGGKGRSRRQI